MNSGAHQDDIPFMTRGNFLSRSFVFSSLTHGVRSVGVTPRAMRKEVGRREHKMPRWNDGKISEFRFTLLSVLRQDIATNCRDRKRERERGLEDGRYLGVLWLQGLSRIREERKKRAMVGRGDRGHMCQDHWLAYFNRRRIEKLYCTDARSWSIDINMTYITKSGNGFRGSRMIFM